MKRVKALSLLITMTSLLLTSCDLERRAFCLETFLNVDYLNGYCMKLSNKDIVETAYVFCLPDNPEDSEENYQYAIKWSKLSPDYFTFVRGLEGKKVTSVTAVNLNSPNRTIKLSVTGSCLNAKSASGYLKISSEAFIANNEKTKNASLYAYFAVGEYEGTAPKPSDISF